ncbi:thyrotropin-releasing hormone receptor-like [Paramacrobiotus metropolitanus]|uniref:thyrotropin-releasing hormone receptor-like n=1 Tax=Paramacrobiotus metropolitanus TaxID=2943436 RepID=UPI00244583DC|nr:thyrotropin-releasing hormone receptor-like [Paramacrobiotus metropolitanus]XP_055340677.1 thyrotropin-releasing hormone receptor-like [Paramacrobiotus metropolitanus]
MEPLGMPAEWTDKLIINTTFPAPYALYSAALLNASAGGGVMRNGTFYPAPRATMFPLPYRIIGTILHSIIFFIGFLGNVMICIVVRKTRSLHTPTYCYLVSLAVADILVVCSAIPEAILSYHLYSKQWVLGHFGCSLMVFTNFLSINSGSISILAFTVERYVAICHPMSAQTVCTVSRARKIIVGIWIVVLLYSAPWLGLAVTKPLILFDVKGLEKCDYRLKRDFYLSFFVADVAIFYFLPLAVSVILYVRMGCVLYRSIQAVHKTTADKLRRRVTIQEDMDSMERMKADKANNATDAYIENMSNAVRSRIQVVKMLVVVVASFAILWLPYRGLLVYNSISKKPYMDMYYVLFAKTLVYCNSAINPFLYTVLSKRFRAALFKIISCKLGMKNQSILNKSMRPSLGLRPSTLYTQTPITSRRMYRTQTEACTYMLPTGTNL